jgi:hypothetical protein
MQITWMTHFMNSLYDVQGGATLMLMLLATGFNSCEVAGVGVQ